MQNLQVLRATGTSVLHVVGRTLRRENQITELEKAS